MENNKIEIGDLFDGETPKDSETPKGRDYAKLDKIFLEKHGEDCFKPLDLGIMRHIKPLEMIEKTNKKQLTQQEKVLKGLEMSVKQKLESLKELGLFDSEIWKHLTGIQRQKYLANIFGGTNEDVIKKHLAKVDNGKKDKRSVSDFVKKYDLF